MFSRLFGKKRQSLEKFARRASKLGTSIVIEISEVSRLLDALTDALLEKYYPTLERHEAFRHACNGLTLTCPNCGAFSEQVVLTLYNIGATSRLAQFRTRPGVQKQIFLGPNVAALGEGQCPGCRGHSVHATFDPTKIKAR